MGRAGPDRRLEPWNRSPPQRDERAERDRAVPVSSARIFADALTASRS
jgi:hypothetical protein